VVGWCLRGPPKTSSRSQGDQRTGAGFRLVPDPLLRSSLRRGVSKDTSSIPIDREPDLLYMHVEAQLWVT
jgi:hypothetical protein